MLETEEGLDVAVAKNALIPVAWPTKPGRLSSSGVKWRGDKGKIRLCEDWLHDVSYWGWLRTGGSGVMASGLFGWALSSYMAEQGRRDGGVVGFGA